MDRMNREAIHEQKTEKPFLSRASFVNKKQRRRSLTEKPLMDRKATETLYALVSCQRGVATGSD